MSESWQEPQQLIDLPPSENSRQAADLAALKRMLQLSQGTFSLSFAVCNDRSLRDDLIKLVKREFSGLLLVELPANTSDIYQTVIAESADRQAEAIFVVNLEESVPSQAQTLPVLQILNSSREAWEKLACPVVIWLAEYAATQVATKAPDFWRYRSHQFEFVGEWHGSEADRIEPFPGYSLVEGLPVEEKRFRMAELEQRIQEAGEKPSAELLPHVLEWLSELSFLYRSANRFAQAERLLRKGLALIEAGYDEGSPIEASFLNNLARILQDTNRLAEAETLMRRVIAIGEQQTAQQQPNVATYLNNLASLLCETNRLTEAEVLVRRALTIDEQHYGSDHPNVATSLNNLAHLLKATNRLQEAEPMLRRALAIDAQSHVPEHPRIATHLSNLASLLRATNRLPEAEPLLLRALAIDEESYGPEHPNVAIRLNNLAYLLQDMNRFSEAEPLVRRAIKIDEQCYGLRHPAVARKLNNLAHLFLLTGRYAEAEPLLNQALAITEQSYGPDHPEVAFCLANLAGVFRATNRLLEAERILRRAVKIFQQFHKASGYQHPMMSVVMNNYASLLTEMDFSSSEMNKRVGTLLESPIRSSKSDKLPSKPPRKKPRRSGQSHRRRR